MGLIKIKQKTDSSFINGEIYDDFRRKEIYFLGIKIWGFEWTINRGKQETKKQSIGFNKHD